MCCGIVGTCGLGVVAVAVTALGVADVGAGLRAIGWLCVDGTRVMRVVGSSSSATACVGVVAYASNGAACWFALTCGCAGWLEPVASELIEDADADAAGADEAGGAAGAAEADDDFFFMTSSDLRRLNSSSLRLPASRDARLRSSIAEVTTLLSAVTISRGRWRLHSALVPPSS